MNQEMSSDSLTDSQRLIARHHVQHKRRWFKAVALLLAAVGAGVVIGAAGAVLYFNKSMHRVPPESGAIVDAMLNRIRQLNNTTPDEESRMRAVMEKHMEEVDELRRNYFDDTRRMFESMDTEIDGILGAERGRVWREYKDKRAAEKRMERHKRRRPPHQ